MSQKTVKKKRIQAVKGQRKWEFTKQFNPLLPNVQQRERLAKFLILF